MMGGNTNRSSDVEVKYQPFPQEEYRFEGRFASTVTRPKHGAKAVKWSQHEMEEMRREMKGKKKKGKKTAEVRAAEEKQMMEELLERAKEGVCFIPDRPIPRVANIF